MNNIKTISTGFLGLLSSSGSLLFGTCATACAAGGGAACAVPLLSFFGVSSATLAQLSWLKYILIPMSIIFFAVAFYRLYRKPKVQACSTTDANCNCEPKQSINKMKLTLWASFILSFALMGWTVYKNSSSQSTQSCQTNTACNSSAQCSKATAENNYNLFNASYTDTTQKDTTASCNKKSACSSNKKCDSVKKTASKPSCTKSCDKPTSKCSNDTTSKKPSCDKSKPCSTPCGKE